VASAEFWDNSENLGTVVGNATFDNNSLNSGSVSGNAIFNGNSGNFSGTVLGDSIFNGTSYNIGTVNNAIFNGISTNGGDPWPGTVLGNATFNDSSYSTSYGVVNGTITWSDKNPNIYAPGSSIYFCPDTNPSPEYLWARHANWFRDSSCSTRANRTPLDGDIVNVEGNTFTDQPDPISLLSFIGNLPESWDSGSANISIQAGGVLSVSTGYWFGSSHASAIVTFTGSSMNVGVIAGDAIFNDNSINALEGTVNGATFNGSSFSRGTILGNAIFNDNSEIIQGTVAGTATFNNNSQVLTIFVSTFSGAVTFNGSSRCEAYGPNPTGEVYFLAGSTFNDSSVNNCINVGNTAFYGSSYNNSGATIVGYAEFYNESINAGLVEENATFYNMTTNLGTVSGTASFYGSSINGDSMSQGTIEGDAFFSNDSYNNSIILGNATFNDNSFNDTDGTVSGTITWGSGNFNGPSDIYFCPDSNPSPDYYWATVGNWYRDSGCESMAYRTPRNGDRVFVLGAPFVDQPSAITLSSFEGSLYDYETGVYESAYISIGANGSLTLNNGIWFGSTDSTATAIFKGLSRNRGTINGDASFRDYSWNDNGFVGGDIEFNDNSSTWGYATLPGNHVFNNNSIMYSGVVEGSVTFNNDSKIILAQAFHFKGDVVFNGDNHFDFCFGPQIRLPIVDC
jgi:hypothetical protein